MRTLKRQLPVITGISLLLAGCKKDTVPAEHTVNVVNSAAQSDIILQQSGSDITGTFQPKDGYGQDVYVEKRKKARAQNKNDVAELSISSWVYGDTLYGSAAYVWFTDLGIIQTDAQIVSARLKLTTPPASVSVPQGNSGNNAANVYRVTGRWDEATLTFANEPPHTTEGAAYMAPAPGPWSYTTDVDVTEMVKYMVANPAESFGFYISLINQTPYHSLVFGTSEQPEKKYRPKLVVNYNIPTAGQH